jgi:hypothetical protein
MLEEVAQELRDDRWLFEGRHVRRRIEQRDRVV